MHESDNPYFPTKGDKEINRFLILPFIIFAKDKWEQFINVATLDKQNRKLKKIMI